MNINTPLRLSSVLHHLQRAAPRAPPSQLTPTIITATATITTTRFLHTKTMANQASWIPAPTKPVSVGDAETYTPGAGELLVKIGSIAFTPIEAKIQK